MIIKSHNATISGVPVTLHEWQAETESEAAAMAYLPPDIETRWAEVPMWHGDVLARLADAQSTVRLEFVDLGVSATGYAVWRLARPSVHAKPTRKKIVRYLKAIGRYQVYECEMAIGG